MPSFAALSAAWSSTANECFPNLQQSSPGVILVSTFVGLWSYMRVTFAKAARHGVRFLRRFGSPPRCPTFPDIDFKNYHRYELADFGSERSQVGRAMAQVAFTMEKFDSATKPHEVWWAVRQGTIEMLDRLEVAQSFGVRVSANAPTKSLNTVALIKPLFDGIICALHCQKGELDGQASQWLAHALDVDETTIRDQLIKQSEPPLGDQANLIMPYRTGVK